MFEMHANEFIKSIKTVVAKRSVESVIDNLTSPPGKKPEQNLVELSKWFNNLKDEDKTMVGKVIEEAIDSSIFSFLCVLDGVRPIEYDEDKGDLQLFYTKAGVKELLNDPEK